MPTADSKFPTPVKLSKFRGKEGHIRGETMGKRAYVPARMVQSYAMHTFDVQFGVDDLNIHVLQITPRHPGDC
jgi:hypothetical protein